MAPGPLSQSAVIGAKPTVDDHCQEAPLEKAKRLAGCGLDGN